MPLKRNVLTLALMSAGIGLAAYANVGLAASAPSNGPQDQTQTQSQASATDQNAKNKKKNSKKESHKPEHITQLQAVQVNGFISSIENSTALKRDANTIVEAVSAEQVGKLPGVSIADALGRLPGIGVQTVDGRPQVLSIHGLGPDFSTALINGGEQVSTNNNRDVAFDQYPSSWFDNVVVHLSPEADLLGQGLAGTVDMHTIRPLDKAGPEAAINAHYIWNGMSQLASGPGVSNKGYNVNGVWVDQFADHTLGVTLGVDLENNPSQIEHQAPWGYPNDTAGNLVVGGSKNYGISDSMKRNGLLATVQWRPSKYYTGTVDMTYDNFWETQQAKGMELPLWWGNGAVAPKPTLVEGTVSNGFVKSGTYENIDPVIRNDFNNQHSKVYNLNWDNKFHLSDEWSLDFDANYSRATSKDVNLESYSGTGYYCTSSVNCGTPSHGPAGSFNFEELPDGMLYATPSLDYTNGVVLTDPQGWGAGNNVVQAGFINAPRTVDYLYNLRFNVERDFLSGPFSSMDFGLSKTTRNKTYNVDQYFLTLGGGFFSPTNTPVMTAPFSGSACDPLAWMGMGSELCYNPFTLIDNGTLTEVPTFESSLSFPPNWRTHEDDLNPYLQFNLDTHLGWVSLRGNFGIQIDQTNQTSDGQRVAPGSALTGGHTQLIPVSGGTNYTRYLPSMNLIFGFTQNDDLRVSAARTMAQPRMDQMNAGLAVSGNITQLASTDPNKSYFSANGGNAALLPTMSENYNVSYEHYFSGGTGYQCNSNDAKNSALCLGGGGYFALSAYYLKLYDYIDPNAAYLYDFSAFIPSYLNASQQAQLGTPYGIISGPTNDGHGNVKGLQATLNLPFGVISQALNGFGVILSADRTASSIIYGDNPNPITVPGLSKWVAGATVYYERNGFAARVSDNYRSDFLGEVSGISASRIEQYLKGGSTYDAQVSYTFESGRFKGLTLVAQGSNLSNKIFSTYQNNDPRQTLIWEEYGRRFDVGISYKFF
ncbi:MAG: TonB-dependent receptor [Rhodanobacteraceae bacterium]